MDQSREVSCSMSGFLDERLGKGVVVAKDRPNFIANRIGTFGALVTMRDDDRRRLLD